jgi:predicted transport protein
MAKTAVAAHFKGREPLVREIYDRLVDAAKQFGPVKEEPKKTSIHLARKTAFAGVATRRDALILTLKSTADIRSPRIIKRDQASANRWYLEVKLTDPKQVDKQIAAWLERAIDISR